MWLFESFILILNTVGLSLLFSVVHSGLRMSFYHVSELFWSWVTNVSALKWKGLVSDSQITDHSLLWPAVWLKHTMYSSEMWRNRWWKGVPSPMEGGLGSLRLSWQALQWAERRDTRIVSGKKERDRLKELNKRMEVSDNQLKLLVLEAQCFC